MTTHRYLHPDLVALLVVNLLVAKVAAVPISVLLLADAHPGQPMGFFSLLGNLLGVYWKLVVIELR